jgi:hypothetical protein
MAAKSATLAQHRTAFGLNAGLFPTSKNITLPTEWEEQRANYGTINKLFTKHGTAIMAAIRAGSTPAKKSGGAKKKSMGAGK